MSKRRGSAPPGHSFSTSGEKINDDVIINHLRDYRSDPFLAHEGGSKILSKYFQRDHSIIVNHKKVYRLCKENNLLLTRRKKKKSKFKKLSINREVTKENQVWEFDIKYGFIAGEKRFFFLLAFIDVFTRELKAWHVGRSCTGEDLTLVLNSALYSEGITEDDNLVIRSDNGSQMTSKHFQANIEKLLIEHEFIPVKTPNKNAHIESFFSIVDKHLQYQYFWSLKEAYEWMIEFINYYNEDRIHGSLGMSPIEFSNTKELHCQAKFAQAI